MDGVDAYPELIHFIVQQKLTQYYSTAILQIVKKKKKTSEHSPLPYQLWGSLPLIMPYTLSYS